MEKISGINTLHKKVKLPLVLGFLVLNSIAFGDEHKTYNIKEETKDSTSLVLEYPDTVGQKEMDEIDDKIRLQDDRNSAKRIENTNKYYGINSIQDHNLEPYIKSEKNFPHKNHFFTPKTIIQKT